MNWYPELRQSQPARVVGRVGLEQVPLTVPEAHVEMGAAAGQV